MNYKYHRIENTLKAKYKFLMNNYDQSSVVKKLEIDDLKKLVETNTAVNQQIDLFDGQLAVTQTEIQTRENQEEFEAKQLS